MPSKRTLVAAAFLPATAAAIALAASWLPGLALLLVLVAVAFAAGGALAWIVILGLGLLNRAGGTGRDVAQRGISAMLGRGGR